MPWLSLKHLKNYYQSHQTIEHSRILGNVASAPSKHNMLDPGTILPFGLLSDPFKDIALPDPFLTVTYRKLLSDVYVNYSNDYYVFQMFTFKPLMADTPSVYVQFLFPGPARWFDLSLSGSLNEFRNHQRQFMKGPQSSFAAIVSSAAHIPPTLPVKRGQSLPNATVRKRHQPIPKNDIPLRDELINAKLGDAMVSSVFSDQQPCNDITHKGKLILKFSNQDPKRIKVFLAGLNIYLYFLKNETCVECVRQVSRGIISSI